MEHSSQTGTATAEIHTNEPYDGEVVITGLSGRLPESANIQEFRDNLMTGTDMITENDRRWTPGLFGLPKRHGKLKDLTKFDNEHFNIHAKQTHYMDPQLRLLFEVTYEAIIDAGVDPNDLRGSRTGVFVGCQAPESGALWSATEEWDVGYILTGTALNMYSNRLSYYYDFKGPSFSMDTACSSSMLAVNQALASIRRGDCDAAIVGGTNLNLQPITALHFNKLGMLAPDGSCKSFDEKGDGYCRSEAVVAIFLQKKPDAKRIYATLVHSKTNSDGHKPEGVTFPSGELQRRLLRECYKEAGIRPSDVAYVEAHGTGTVAGDSQEGNAICDVFCEGREDTLLIGSVKSNCGHPESPSGVCGIAKVIVAMEENNIPANLHYNSPNPEIPGLLEGRMKVVSENTKWNGGIVGLNSFGFGGSNVHVILKSNEKEKTPRCDGEKPRLFVYGSRTMEAVQDMLTLAQKNSSDLELHGLLNETANLPLNTHSYRGFTILNGHDRAFHTEKASIVEKRPVWFVLSGMGSQWPAMCRDMMSIDVFRNSIIESDAILKPYGIKLYENLTSDGKQFEKVVNSTTGIIATQVALIDTLAFLGIKPDGIVGHSIGEISCAYADECMTAKEAVLTAYWRGHCIEVVGLPKGAMAAIGMTWEEALEQCPSGVTPACHNSEDSVTVSGEVEAVQKFVEELQAKEVFAKVVDSAGVAFHSPFMQKVAPALQRALEQTISPKERSAKWISSAFPESEWSTETAKYSSAEYQVKNVVSPVLFAAALKHVPSDAVVIEIAPHSLLLPILRRSLGKDSSTVGLMKKGQKHNDEFFLAALGKCYQAGLDVDPLKFFEPVEFPVSRGTPMIASSVKWDHSNTWKVAQFKGDRKDVERGTIFEIDISDMDSEWRYLMDHKIDGHILFPGAGYLELAWRAAANREGRKQEETPILIEDVAIHRATILSTSAKTRLEVNLIPGTDEFQILEGMDLVCEGRMRVPERKELSKFLDIDESTEEVLAAVKDGLEPDDLYKEFRILGYQFGPSFWNILKSNFDASRAIVKWFDNWTLMIDSLAQLGVPGYNVLHVPVGITTLMIDPQLHLERVIELEDGQKGIKTYKRHESNDLIGGGVRAYGFKKAVSRYVDRHRTLMESHSFIPFSKSMSTEAQESLNDYAGKCLRLSVKTIQRMVNSGTTNGLKSLLDDGLLKGIPFKEHGEQININTDDTHTSCLQLLAQLSELEHDEGFVETAFELIQSKTKALQSDQLFGHLLQEQYLKPCFDIIVENLQMMRMNVLEVAQRNLTSSLYRLVKWHPLVEVTCKLATTYPDAFEDVPEKRIIEDVMYWKLGDDKSMLLPKSHMVMFNNTLRKQPNLRTALSTLSDSLLPGGYIIVNEITKNFQIAALLDSLYDHAENIEYEDLRERTCGTYLDHSAWKKLFADEEFEVISEVTDNLLTSLFLLKKKSTNKVEDQTIVNIDQSCDWVEELKEKLEEVQNKPKGSNLWLKASGYESGVLGVVFTLRYEDGADRIRCILDMDDNNKALDEKTFASMVSRDLVVNIHRQGEWGSYRFLPLQQVSTIPSEHAYIVSTARGDMSSLKWCQSRLKYYNQEKEPEKILCNVHYASLNFRDVMLATGTLPQEAIPNISESEEGILGFEFSGKDTKGNRVTGILQPKALATSVVIPHAFTVQIPDSWSLQEAATVPVAYTTAIYALIVRGRLRRGESILIHSGTGGVGQAALNIALHYGCKIFTTVGTEEKRKYLKEQFPQLQDGNIFSSRDTAFDKGIFNATNGRGVDLVLNSLAGDKLQASVRSLAKGGRFLEIGKVDLFKNTGLGMSEFLKNISFHGILVDLLLGEVSNPDFAEIQRILVDGTKKGYVKPLPATVFDKDEIEKAFRYMAAGTHMGKVLVKVRDGGEKISVPAIPRSYCDPEKAYIITGGLGGVGLELARWLADRGAKCLVLTSRSGVKTGYQKGRIRLLESRGVEVIVSSRNICDKADTEKLFEETNGKPVGGIFHLAMVLKDGHFSNMRKEDFKVVCEPKVGGALNLDEVSRKKCNSSLDWFVVFSSISSGRGSAGQCNYSFANSTIERLCEKRRREGLHGLAIQWGPIGDVGVFFQAIGDNDTVYNGTLPQRILSLMAHLDICLNQPEPVISCYVAAEKTASSGGEGVDLLEKVMKILGIVSEDELQGIDKNKSLGDLGIDSLLGVEVKTTLEKDYNLTLTPKELRDLTIQDLENLSKNRTSTPKQQLEEQGVNLEGTEVQFFLTKKAFREIIPKDLILKLNDVTEGTPIFIVHHVFGHADVLDNMAKDVKVPVYGLQRSKEVFDHVSSIEAMAAFYNKVIEDFIPDQDFYVSGYSFGSTVAQEMALQLQNRENRHLKGVILLDGSSMYAMLFKHALITVPDHIEVKAVRALIHLYGMRIEGDQIVFDENLFKEKTTTLAAKNPDLTPEGLLKFGKVMHKCVEISCDYNPSGMYHGDIHLIAAEKNKAYFPIDDDYGLKEFCDGKIEVSVVDGGHVSFIKRQNGLKVAQTLNRIVLGS